MKKNDIENKTYPDQKPFLCTEKQHLIQSTMLYYTIPKYKVFKYNKYYHTVLST